MKTAGYSPTPLHKKLGIKPGMRIRVVDGPDNYNELVAPPGGVSFAETGSADLVHLFVTTRVNLEKRFARLVKELSNEGIIWISWYKKSSGMPTDVTEDVIREVVLPSGWVDVKVCAVTEQWSGLKIVKRLALR